LTCYTEACISLWTPNRARGDGTVPYGRKEPAINTDPRTQQGDLIVGLLNLLERNRLALVVLAASLTSGARLRARGACSDLSAARWISRNARLVRHFLASLATLRQCAGRAGYRALSRHQPIRRLHASPRILIAMTAARAHLVAPVTRGSDRTRPLMQPSHP
jgi:hypothetical protein